MKWAKSHLEINYVIPPEVKPPFFSVNSTPGLGKYIFSRFHNVFLLESNGHGHDS